VAERAEVKLLKRLARRGGTAGAADRALVASLAERGLVALAKDGPVLTETGRAHLRRCLAGDDAYAIQHQTRAVGSFEEAGARFEAVVNLDESPLARLQRMTRRDGAPLLDPASVAAGERLRADFERGQMQPRVTANWSAAVANGRRDGGQGGLADLTVAALSARRRVEEALGAVGPEFSGILLDSCCFLKGIEEIERERQWPARSAKLVIALGLAALARHYGLTSEATGATGARLRHWGAEGYRPRLDGS